jgi:hypothetical protein
MGSAKYRDEEQYRQVKKIKAAWGCAAKFDNAECINVFSLGSGPLKFSFAV